MLDVPQEGHQVCMLLLLLVGLGQWDTSAEELVAIVGATTLRVQHHTISCIYNAKVTAQRTPIKLSPVAQVVAASLLLLLCWALLLLYSVTALLCCR
jgi:hypothetical protein